VNEQNEAVRTLVSRSLVVVDPDSTLRQAAATLAEGFIGVAIVPGAGPTASRGSHAEGVLSERDIVRALADGADPDVETVRNVMTVDLATAEAGDAISSVAECMLDNEIRHVPVVDDGAVVGIVSERDVLRTLMSQARSTHP
jgi:CBS domain-containing protein